MNGNEENNWLEDWRKWAIIILVIAIILITFWWIVLI